MIRVGHYYRNITSKTLYLVEGFNEFDEVLFCRPGGITFHSETKEKFLKYFEYYNP